VAGFLHVHKEAVMTTITDQTVLDVKAATNYVEIAASYVHDGWAKLAAGDLDGLEDLEQATTWLGLARDYCQIARQPKLYEPIQEISDLVSRLQLVRGQASMAS
jgi:hypothetical protein